MITFRALSSHELSHEENGRSHSTTNTSGTDAEMAVREASGNLQHHAANANASPIQPIIGRLFGSSDDGPPSFVELCRTTPTNENGKRLYHVRRVPGPPGQNRNVWISTSLARHPLTAIHV